MLPADFRLRRTVDFQRVVRAGTRSTSRSVVLHLAARADEEPPRVGFVVTRAIGPAVRRNRVKRRLRALMLERLPLVPTGALLVVRAMPHAATATYADLAADLDRCLGRAGLPRR